MPELPEVETIRSRLAPSLTGRRFERVTILDPRLTRPEPPEAVAAALEGERVADVRRRGKYLIVAFESGRHLLIHLRMTGNVLHPAPTGTEDDSHRRAVVTLDNGSDVVYRDVRRFGTWELLEAGELEEYVAARRLGLEPLERGFTTVALERSLAGRRAPVKAALLDQRAAAGLGNIYADEALWYARINPLTPAGALGRKEIGALRRGIRKALELGIARQGATLRNYRGADGESGRMQHEFRVYGREGEPCPRCGTPVEKIRLGGRGNVVLPELPAQAGGVTNSDPLPAGVRVGHWSDGERGTGCTVVLAPIGAVGACEVRGGGPGTRESDLLSPAAAATGPDAVLLTGGSAYGLAAADGVVRYLAERGIGFRTRAGIVPLVAGAVVYDLALGDAGARPDADAGYAACERASETVPERGSVGVGMGCTVGKLLGPRHWTKGGLGYAGAGLAGGATVTALAAVNAFGDVLAEDGSTLAGVWRDGAYRWTVDLLVAGESRASSWNESTTLVCVLTDAALTKTQAWLIARAASSGVARAVEPSATAVDGDVVYCLAAGTVDADALALSALAADVAAAAIRDAVRSAKGVPGCPSAAERAA